ncbi:MAG: GNAT family N-acetyltransferase [Planctomycetes bacterium]|nr:GNAT family N-acetyltransferase [Planctomycetota bacterium]
MELARFVASAVDLRIETERLVLRRMVRADADVALAHEQDRAMMQWIRDPQPMAAMQERIQAMFGAWTGGDGEWLTLAVAPKATDAMLGIVVCRVTQAANEAMEIGYRLHPSVHRRGYAFEACARLVDHLFAAVRVHKVVAHCVLENEASWRLMEKLGMRREAVFRDYTKLGGAWRDACFYGLLASDRA